MLDFVAVNDDTSFFPTLRLSYATAIALVLNAVL
jgi:hypothetical protein